MKIIRASLSMGLVASGLLGVQILLDDRWLWSAAPSHAYGLTGFVAIDLLLLLALVRRVRIAIVGAAFESAVQFGSMLADMVAGQPTGVPSVAFRAYLLSDTSYLGLLLVQIALLVLATGALTGSLVHKRVRWRVVSFHLRQGNG